MFFRYIVIKNSIKNADVKFGLKFFFSFSFLIYISFIYRPENDRKSISNERILLKELMNFSIHIKEILFIIITRDLVLKTLKFVNWAKIMNLNWDPR